MADEQRRTGGQRQSISKEQLEQLAEQQMARETAGNTPLQAQKGQNKDLLIDTKKLRRRMKISLRAMQKKTVQMDNGETRRMYVANEDDALINEEGFRKIWSLIEGTVNENLTGAYWNTNDEFKVGVQTMHTLIEQIRVKWKQWDIETVEDADQIITLVSDNLKAVTSKARNARAMKYKGEQVQKRILAKEGDENKAGSGWLGGLLN